MLLPLSRFLFRPAVVRRIIQTIRYPTQVGKELPPAEVLSIVVSDQTQGKGIGKALMQAAFEEFQRQGIYRVKVAVEAQNAIANAFYRRCGFNLAKVREHHGFPMNIYVIQLGLPQ